MQLIHLIRTALVSPGLAVQPGLRPALRDDRGGGRLADDGRHLDVHLGARGGPAHRVRRRADVRATLSGTDATQPLQKIHVLSNVIKKRLNLNMSFPISPKPLAGDGLRSAGIQALSLEGPGHPRHRLAIGGAGEQYVGPYENR